MDGEFAAATSNENTVIRSYAVGSYDLEIVDANGCTETCTTTVLPLDCPDLGLNPVGTNPTCATDSSGFIVVGTDSAFVLTYTFAGDTIRNDTLANLSAGDYQIFATDAEGCRDSVTVTLTDPEAIDLTCRGGQVTAPGGTAGIDVRILNGTAPYQIFVDGEFAAATSNENTVIRSYAVGSYDLEIVDANGCTETCTTTILPLECPDLGLNPVGTNPTCASDSSGSIVVGTNSAFVLTYTFAGGHHPQRYTCQLISR